MLTDDEARAGAALLRDLIAGEAQIYWVPLSTRHMPVVNGRMIVQPAFDGKFGDNEYIVRKGKEYYLICVSNDANEIDYINYVCRLENLMDWPSPGNVYEAMPGEPEPLHYLSADEVSALRKLFLKLDGIEA